MDAKLGERPEVLKHSGGERTLNRVFGGGPLDRRKLGKVFDRKGDGGGVPVFVQRRTVDGELNLTTEIQLQTFAKGGGEKVFENGAFHGAVKDVTRVEIERHTSVSVRGEGSGDREKGLFNFPETRKAGDKGGCSHFSNRTGVMDKLSEKKHWGERFRETEKLVRLDPKKPFFGPNENRAGAVGFRDADVPPEEARTFIPKVFFNFSLEGSGRKTSLWIFWGGGRRRRGGVTRNSSFL